MFNWVARAAGYTRNPSHVELREQKVSVSACRLSGGGTMQDNVSNGVMTVHGVMTVLNTKILPNAYLQAKY